MKHMKRNTFNSLFAFGAIVCSLAACSQDEAVLDNNTEDLQTYILYLDADVPNFDSVREGETRASGNRWADGDVIYVSYSNGGNTKVSNATYKSSLGAFQFSSTSLNSVSDASCSVYYFREGTFSVSGNTVTMDKYTAIFSDTSAKYSCSSNVITLSATFKPYTWRLCFKGTAGTQVKLKSVSNIVYNTSLNLSSGAFSTKADSVNLLVQSDGYTPYVYGLFTGSSNTIKVKVGGTYYSRSLSSSKLAVGQSGYFTVPTTGNHANWTTSHDTSGFEYVDLGLPSRLLWAKCNLGGSSEEEYGDFYAWGETSGFDGLDRLFDWTTYKWCEGTSSSLTKYNSSDGLSQLELEDDAAYVIWGSPWRIPTRKDWEELNNNTTKSYETINGINGYRLTSKLNSNSIFLPFAGYFEGSEYKSAGTYANYWTSTLNSTKSQAYIAYTTNSGAIITNNTLERCFTQAIRPVYDLFGEGESLDINKEDYGDDKNLDGSYIIEFKDNLEGGGDGTLLINPDVTSDSIAAEGVEFIADVAIGTADTNTRAYFGRTGYGLKFGTSSKPSNLLIHLSAEGQVTATSIIVRAAPWWNDDTGKIDTPHATINGFEYIVDETKTALQEYEIKFEEPQFIDTLFFSGTERGRYYVKSVTVNYQSR